MPDSPRTTPEWARRGRSGWRYTGRERPAFAEVPGPGQESVWEYPRPPAIVPDPREVRVAVGGQLLAQSRGALRVLETASPPTFYLPASDVHVEWLRAASGESRCEWKGTAGYWDYAGPGEPIAQLAWSYTDPFPEFAVLRDCFAFYPSLAECRVDGERVRAQPGRFYGGWVTSELVGPFKGEAGSQGW